MPAVILLVGIPGAGKSTVARALAARLPRSACIEGDLVQHRFTVSGLVGPGDQPAAESHRQLELRWRNCADLADNFADAGFTAVVEHAAAHRSWLEEFERRLRTRPLWVVVLAPDLAVALERDRARTEKQVAERFAHMDAELRANLAGAGWWLDTSQLTVAETVEAVLAEGISLGVLPA